MDRPFWYYGVTLRDTDLLNAARFPMVGIAKLSEAILGVSTAVSGFTLTPTSPASLSVTLGPGQIYQQENLEATAWAAFGTDTHSIVKQGVMLDAQNLTFVAPTTVGYAQNFLVEVQYIDLDGGSTVLPYYNASNPSVPYSGPGNSGSAQNTIRQGAVAVQVKAGTAAASGTQVSPTPDAGWAALFVVTVAYGQTTVTSGNIAPYFGAPFIPVTLPAVPAGVQAGQWVFFTASGANTYIGSLSPVLSALTPGMEVLGYFGTINTTTSPTLNLNSLGAKPILKQGSISPAAGDITGFVPLILSASGNAWVVNGPVASDILSSISSVTRINLKADINIFVRSDATGTAYTGLTNTPTDAFPSIAAAVSTIFGKYNLAGFSLNVYFGVTGSYAGYDVPNVGVSGAVNFSQASGVTATITPIQRVDGVYCCISSAIQTVNVLGGTYDISTVPAGQQATALLAGPGGKISWSNITVKQTSTNTSASFFTAYPNGIISNLGPFTISGGGTVGYIYNITSAQALGNESATSAAITISGGTMTYTAFYNINNGRASLQNTTFAGSGIGAKYSLSQGAVIDVASSSVAAIPGTTAGTNNDGTGFVLGDLGPAWVTYTPTVAAGSGTFTSATAGGRYQRRGKAVSFIISISIASVGTAAGVVTVSLPFAPFSNISVNGAEFTTSKSLVGRASASGTTMTIGNYDGSSPITAGYNLIIAGTYEALS